MSLVDPLPHGRSLSTGSTPVVSWMMSPGGAWVQGSWMVPGTVWSPCFFYRHINLFTYVSLRIGETWTQVKTLQSSRP